MSQDAGKSKNDVKIPDMTELWKEMYYNNESDWAKTLKGFLGTETFVAMLDKTLEQHLALSKITRQQLDKFSEQGVAPSKKDVARVAELIISMEEKVDVMEFQLFDNFKKLTESMLRMVEFQEKFKDELGSIKEELQLINNKLGDMEKKAAVSPKSKRGTGKKSTEDSSTL